MVVSAKEITCTTQLHLHPMLNRQYRFTESTSWCLAIISNKHNYNKSSGGNDISCSQLCPVQIWQSFLLATNHSRSSFPLASMSAYLSWFFLMGLKIYFTYRVSEVSGYHECAMLWLLHQVSKYQRCSSETFESQTYFFIASIIQQQY